MDPLLLLAAYTALLSVAAWSIGARVRRVLIVACLVAAALFGWFAWSSRLSYLECDRVLSTHRRYEIDTTVNGDRVMRIDALRGIDGIGLVAVPKDGSPPDYQSLLRCQWRARDVAGKVEIRGDHHGLIDVDPDDGFGEGARTWLELTYLVNDDTRPALQSISLEARAPWITLKGCNIHRDVDRYCAAAYAVGALVSLSGFASQIVRLVRGRRHRVSSPPA